MRAASEAFDRAMMARCIDLSVFAIKEGEYPFGAVIALNGQILAEATNRTVRDNDVCRHAEIIALSLAQRKVGRAELPRATLYSSVEPCAMSHHIACSDNCRVLTIFYGVSFTDFKRIVISKYFQWGAGFSILKYTGPI